MRHAPTVNKYCRRCGKASVFQSSGLFRINAQQKTLDVWLVYKCCVCDGTWNLTVLSRVHAASLSAGVLNEYTNNNPELAMRYATDAALIKRNGAECNVAEVVIQGPDYDWCGAAEIHILAKWPLENRAAALIRQKLGLSRSAFEKLCREGKIVCISQHNLTKSKMVGEIVFTLRP